VGMSITEKYRDFILENIVKDKLLIQLPKPTEDGKFLWVKLGISVYIEVKIEVIEKYSRSFKAKLIFDKYEIEQLFFTPLESAPTSIETKIKDKITKLVCKTFFDDNRHEDVLKMYKERENRVYSKIASAVNKSKNERNNI
jgi:hypothetical protein